MMNNAMTMQTLADRQAITDLIYRYCRAVDRIDPELGYTIWHEDAEADYGESIYRGSGRGFIDFVCAQHRRAVCHSHQISNVIIDLDGDRAGSESYVTANVRFAAGAVLKQVTVSGRYIDRWSRREGRWGIDKRIYVLDFEEIRDVPADNRGTGRRDRNDPSYGVLRDPR
jgi:hypothetical protein